MEMHLTQPLHKGRRERPDAAFSVFGARRRTYAETAERVARLAGALRAHGVGHGDRIGILGLNSDRYAETIYAALWLGAVVNPVNVRWSVPEMAYSIDDCQTHVLFVDDTFQAAAQPLQDATDSLKTVIFMGEGQAEDSQLDFETLIAEHDPVDDVLARGDDLAAIMYTGGTTGKPKGVMLSHANMYSNAIASAAAAARPMRPVILQAAPTFHIAGIGFVIGCTLRMGTNVIVPYFEPAAVMKAVQQERAQDLFLVPTMLRMVLDHPEFPNYDLSSLECLYYGASPMDSALLDRAMAALPNTGFTQAYGMTELSPVITILPDDYHRGPGREMDKLASAGLPISMAEVRVVDEDDHEVPYGQVGEICARGPMVMQGYWNKPEQTAEALRNGWMHTGDAGYMDEDGFIFMVDRIKDMIVSGGENVYSAEVEEAILQLPQVAQCAVIGVPDEKWGERVHAAIVLQPGEELTEQQVVDHCKTLIASYKCPRSVEFREEMPMSGAGKLLKYKLREPHWEGRERSVS